MRTFQQPILVRVLAWMNPCEPKEWAGDLLTNVDLAVLVLKAKIFKHLGEMSKGHDRSLPQLYHVVLLAWP